MDEQAGESNEVDVPAPFPPQTPNTPTQAIEAPTAADEPPEAPIRLSAGVALPQPLPTGTAMGFSVDYQFTVGSPRPGFRYLWVIRAAGKEQPWEQEVQLQTSETLQTFVPDWRPADGPFETFIAEVSPDSDRQPITPVQPLKRDGGH